MLLNNIKSKLKAVTRIFCCTSGQRNDGWCESLHFKAKWSSLSYAVKVSLLNLKQLAVVGGHSLTCQC